MIHPAPMVNHAIVGDLEEKKDDDIRSAAAALPKDGKSATTEKPTTLITSQFPRTLSSFTHQISSATDPSDQSAMAEGSVADGL